MSWRTSLLILTQILEALVHLSRYQVAHRDLKTDNILINEAANGEIVEVVLSDFGCCWANKFHGFECPYPTEDVDKGKSFILLQTKRQSADRKYINISY